MYRGKDEYISELPRPASLVQPVLPGGEYCNLRWKPSPWRAETTTTGELLSVYYSVLAYVADCPWMVPDVHYNTD